MSAGVPVLSTANSQTLEHVLQLLRADGVVVLPTETLYGFSCAAESPAALLRIQELKAIPRARGFVALVDSLARLEAVLAPEQEPRALEFLRRTWPEALTAVLRLAHPVAWGESREALHTAAFRVPKHAWLRRLLAALQAPLVSTSVNRSGESPLVDVGQIERQFGARVDAIVDEPRVGGVTEQCRIPSTVLDCTTWPPQVLRAGQFDCAAALRRLGN